MPLLWSALRCRRRAYEISSSYACAVIYYSPETTSMWRVYGNATVSPNDCAFAFFALAGDRSFSHLTKVHVCTSSIQSARAVICGNANLVMRTLPAGVSLIRRRRVLCRRLSFCFGCHIGLHPALPVSPHRSIDTWGVFYQCLTEL
jgi:hypothetical protein